VKKGNAFRLIRVRPTRAAFFSARFQHLVDDRHDVSYVVRGHIFWRDAAYGGAPNRAVRMIGDLDISQIRRDWRLVVRLCPRAATKLAR
jgi:hypothetical protein